MTTHNVTDKSKDYPQSHKVIFPKPSEDPHTINVQSNVEIRENENVIYNGITYRVERIIKKVLTMPMVFVGQANDGLYIEGLTTFYVLGCRPLSSTFVGKQITLNRIK